MKTCVYQLSPKDKKNKVKIIELNNILEKLIEEKKSDFK